MMNNNQSKGALTKVVSQQTIKTHNCPNCNCIQTASSHLAIQRSLSPQYNFEGRQLPTPLYANKISNIPYIISTMAKKQYTLKKSPIQNIYFRRTERANSKSSVSSNQSFSKISKEDDPVKTFYSPSKSTKINIMYISPPKESQISQQILQTSKICTPNQQSIKNLSNTGLLREFQKSIYYQKQARIHTKTIHQQNSVCQQQPKTPSILKKKSSSGIRKKSSRKQSQILSSQLIQNLSDQPRLKKKQSSQLDLGTASMIYSRNAIHRTPTGQQYLMKGQWGQPSAYDLLLEQQQQRAIAQQLSKDLKLHYDYLDTIDVSNLSAHAN